MSKCLTLLVLIKLQLIRESKIKHSCKPILSGESLALTFEN